MEKRRSSVLNITGKSSVSAASATNSVYRIFFICYLIIPARPQRAGSIFLCNALITNYAIDRDGSQYGTIRNSFYDKDERILQSDW
nr:MAG TPA: hypothetical protein [Bacteriophage sp.]